MIIGKLSVYLQDQMQQQLERNTKNYQEYGKLLNLNSLGTQIEILIVKNVQKSLEN